MVEDCIFCQIAGGKSAADIVYDDGDVIFFRDISPKAPVHVVAIPKQHLSSLDAVTAEEAGVVAQLLIGVTHVAQQLGLAEDGYRVIANVGRHAGQEVQHLHFHILGGEPLGPLRC
jgi:histidine triad (HIT) family protein